MHCCRNKSSLFCSLLFVLYINCCGFSSLEYVSTYIYKCSNTVLNGSHWLSSLLSCSTRPSAPPHITVRSINVMWTRYGTLCTNVNMVGAYDTFACEHISGLQKHYLPNFILETGLLCHILLTSPDFQSPRLQMTLLYNKYPLSEPTNNLAV